ncbi:hypothetical protein [Streptomyces sp. ISL-98]|uniref:hypothetical protein n=1 Tax=Streptomyces sp. ISL-98 TaxID=2819192 RepID=UPI0027E52725|nr:hypothetical protein [Streptomyces sp. ISL-98]
MYIESAGEVWMRLVFVHGIGGPRECDRELADWKRALAAGMSVGGHTRMARELERPGGAVECVFAYYGDLFRRPQAQGAGSGPLDDEEARILVDLLAELVDVLAAEHEQNAGPTGHKRGGDDYEAGRRLLEHARAEAAPRPQAQGSMSLVRRALNVATTLLSWQPWGGAAQWAAPKLMVRDLAQVSRYLARVEHDKAGVGLDRRIRARVTEAVGDGPAVVVAHSLGTIVALEALHELRAAVPLFVTLGSPLAMRTVVRPKLVPQPPGTPHGLACWLNFWDRDDVIAVRPILERDFTVNAAAVGPDSRRVDSDGIWVHSAVKYLAQPGVAAPIAEALPQTGHHRGRG